MNDFPRNDGHAGAPVRETNGAVMTARKVKVY
jgi:hypothetical protein